MRCRASVAALVLAAIVTGTAGCGSSGEATITVGAAASLTDVLPVIGAAFEEANPGVRVAFTFAGSSSIAEQIVQGAPIDVVAAAGPGPLDALVADGLVAQVQPFATNGLAIAVPPGNPAGVSGLADLPRASVAVCQEQVPCGSATLRLFERNAIDIAPVTLEPDVRAVLTKVSTDEVDAGIVYITDVVGAGERVEGIPIPADRNVVNVYPLGLVTGAADREAARAFIDFVLSDEGQRLLADAGFGPP